MGVDPRWKLISKAKKAFSGERNDFVPAIYDVVEAAAWRSYTRPMQEETHQANFSEFIRAEFGVEPDVIQGMLRTSGMKALAEKVLALIRSDMPSEIRPNRRPTREESLDDKCSATTLTEERGGTYNVRRLKRDRPDLAEKVINGDMSPNAAAVEAGFRHPTISVRADDPSAFIRAGLRRYTREELLAALNES